MNYYIKERNNPQFKKPYYMKEGKLSKKDAKKKEDSIYGYNRMIPYSTETEYLAAIEDLKAKGFDIH